MKHLLEPSELSYSGRPVGQKIDEPKFSAYINEAEQMNVKPVLGDNLFLDLLEKGEEKEEYRLLLTGGSYEHHGEYYSFAGLKEALSYFVYAKFIMVGDFVATRYGMSIKEDAYSSHLSSADRSNAYNDTLEVANTYLKDCVRYCKHKDLLDGKKANQTATGGVTIRKIDRLKKLKKQWD